RSHRVSGAAPAAIPAADPEGSSVVLPLVGRGSVHVNIGVRVPHTAFERGPDAVAAFVEAAEDAGFDRLWVGDHVSFRGGYGYDGLLQSTAVALVRTRTTVP